MDVSVSCQESHAHKRKFKDLKFKEFEEKKIPLRRLFVFFHSIYQMIQGLWWNTALGVQEHEHKPVFSPLGSSI